MGRGWKGRSVRETEPAFGHSCDVQRAGLGSAPAGRAEAESSHRLSLPRVSYDARTGGGTWPSWRLETVVRREPRRLQCVRRTTRGQRGPTEESEPETARSRSVRSQDAEHPGAQLQHVSTAPSPRVAYPPSLSPAFLSDPRVRSSGYAPPTPSLCLWFPPRACRATPTQGHAPEVPTAKTPRFGPTGGEGKTEAQGLTFRGPRSPAHSGLGQYRRG